MSSVGKWRADAERAKKKAKPWRSGWCNPSNPPASHMHCLDHPRRDGVPCCCDRHIIEAHILTTPDAWLVTEAEPETPEWFAARREGITGTDLPKILGLTKYGNSLSVWLDKRGELDDEAGEAARWGQILEDPVAQEWARRNGAQVERVGVLANDTEPWMRASLDRLVITCPDGGHDCGLEVKTRSAFKSSLFRSEVPDDVLAQVAWGLIVSGLHHMHVAVLLGGQTLKSFRVDRDETLEKYLIDAARPVWTAVTEGVPPEAHPDSEGVLLDLLDSLYSKRAGERELDAEKARPWLDQYAEGGDLERRGKALKTQAKTALVQMLDDGDAALIDGEPVFTYRVPSPTDTITAANLRALREDNPEVYDALRADGYVTVTNPRPRFTMEKQSAKAGES